MPTPALSAGDLARLKSDLELRRTALRIEVKAQMTGSGDDRVVGLSNRLNENDDWAVADALAELDIAGATHVLKDLTEVDAALARMRTGEYGECPDCGKAIAIARLLAYPTAKRCVSCQAAFERKVSGPPLTAV
jgi:RNA polymerase-binding transcription factor DksA